MGSSAASALLTEANARASKLAHAELDVEALETLLTALRAQPPDNEARIAALVPFCVHSADVDVDDEEIIQSQALPALVQLLAPDRTAEVQLAAMTAILALYLGGHFEDEVFATLVIEFDLIQSLALLLGSAEECVHARAARLLGIAASCSQGQDDEVAAAGVTMAPLIPLLRSADEMAQCDAAHAIGYFAESTALRDGRALAEAIPLLVSLLGSANTRVQQGAAHAICELAMKHTTYYTALLDGGFCERVVQLLLAIQHGPEEKGSAKGSAPSPARVGRSDHNTLFSPVMYHAGSVLEIIVRRDAHRAAIANTPGLVGALLRITHGPEEENAASFGHDWARDLLETLLVDATKDVRLKALASAGESHAQLAHSEGELRGAHARLRAKLCSLADAVGEPTRQHDVVLQCADGTELGASRLLLARHSEYYEAQLRGGLAEGGQREVRADPTFSSAAHEALLRQLHSAGEAPLPAEPSVVLELLRLTNKLQPPTPPAAATAGSEDAPAAHAEANVLAGVARQCEDVLLAALDVDNCLDMLRHAKAAGGCARLVEGVRALAREEVKAIVKQERWAAFKRDDPAEAFELMEMLAVDFADRERASKRQCVM